MISSKENSLVLPLFLKFHVSPEGHRTNDVSTLSLHGRIPCCLNSKEPTHYYEMNECITFLGVICLANGDEQRLKLMIFFKPKELIIAF